MSAICPACRYTADRCICRHHHANGVGASGGDSAVITPINVSQGHRPNCSNMGKWPAGERPCDCWPAVRFSLEELENEIRASGVQPVPVPAAAALDVTAPMPWPFGVWA